jgi:hypothetical protein
MTKVNQAFAGALARADQQTYNGRGFAAGAASRSGCQYQSNRSIEGSSKRPGRRRGSQGGLTATDPFLLNLIYFQ